MCNVLYDCVSVSVSLALCHLMILNVKLYGFVTGTYRSCCSALLLMLHPTSLSLTYLWLCFFLLPRDKILSICCVKLFYKRMFLHRLVYDRVVETSFCYLVLGFNIEGEK